LPLIVWGKLLGIRTVTHEQTLTRGTANRIISRFADQVLVSWPESLTGFPPEKTVLVGNPLRRSLFMVTTGKFDFENGLPLLYVTGGNQGANTINWRLFKILPVLLEKTNVIHQVGGSTLTGDLEEAGRIKSSLPEPLRQRYLFYENVYSAELAEIFSRADLVLSRAGANTICELLAFGKRAVLIPIPWSAGDEQTANARIVVKTGLGLILRQYDAMPPSELQRALELGLLKVSRGEDFLGRDYQTAKLQAQALVDPDAAVKFVDAILSSAP
jgi:UDP-N-acetylglucosamine--N-acetylmuramyl-(pentapeptide) pyrophosphoryl-undecaprenol N-acetylglucosamine transferase